MAVKQELVEKRNKLDALRKKVAKINEESKSGNDYDFTKATDLTGDATQRLSDYRKMLEEVEGLGSEVEKLAAIVKGLDTDFTKDNDGVDGGMVHDDAKGTKSLGEMFAKSGLAERFVKSNAPVSQEFGVGMKTLLQTSAGWAPESTRTGEVVPYAFEPVKLFPLIPKGMTGMATVAYMAETTRTQAAAERSEAGAYAESEFKWEEQSETVRSLGHFIPVTDEQLEDVPQLQSILDGEMRAGVMERLEYQLINGNGVAPNVKGALNLSSLQTQAKGSDPSMDAVYKAMTKVSVTGKANVNIVVLHPNDWQDIRLLRTTDGIYIFGNPSDPGVPRLWGVGVVTTTNIAENTGLVGDFATYCMYVERRGINVEITNSHDTYFIYGKQAIRASVRACFKWTRETAFCEVTGI